VAVKSNEEKVNKQTDRWMTVDDGFFQRVWYHLTQVIPEKNLYRRLCFSGRLLGELCVIWFHLSFLLSVAPEENR